MKKIIFTFALLVQTAFAMATDNQTLVAQVRHENVKMYQQAGTSTPVIKALSTTDRLQVVRRYNEQWTIVTVDGQVGYILHSEIAKPAAPTYQNLAINRTKR